MSRQSVMRLLRAERTKIKNVPQFFQKSSVLVNVGVIKGRIDVR